MLAIRRLGLPAIMYGPKPFRVPEREQARHFMTVGIGGVDSSRDVCGYRGGWQRLICRRPVPIA
jgi:hypothetical protein